MTSATPLSGDSSTTPPRTLPEPFPSSRGPHVHDWRGDRSACDPGRFQDGSAHNQPSPVCTPTNRRGRSSLGSGQTTGRGHDQTRTDSDGSKRRAQTAYGDMVAGQTLGKGISTSPRRGPRSSSLTVTNRGPQGHTPTTAFNTAVAVITTAQPLVEKRTERPRLRRERRERPAGSPRPPPVAHAPCVKRTYAGECPQVRGPGPPPPTPGSMWPRSRGGTGSYAVGDSVGPGGRRVRGMCDDPRLPTTGRGSSVRRGMANLGGVYGVTP